MVDSIADLEQQLANTRDYWLGWGRADRSAGDLTLYRSSVSHPQLNGVLRVGHGQSLDAVVAEAEGRLRGVPWMWWVGPDSRSDLADHLLATGATEIGTMPVMAARVDRAISVDTPPELEIEQVAGPDSLREWVTAYAPSFGVAPDQVHHVIRAEDNRPDQSNGLVRFAGRWNGRLVGTSALLDRHGVAGIYVVTTAAEYRRRGIGTALTAAALREARERGLRVATLQASPDGAPVYHRMGFETVAGYRMFTPAQPRPAQPDTA
ncbi:GNAT family N-acetyltransferase [Nonomuraea sp. SYSU D8015]|uniref:GNAT family N-acetyltransferase n=1 Tax=Nonomuraea sp. SYSU D8015 TaxID=2593644 RepID=UPI001CB720DF|nr:GNAT family N-acetyltransferase [Nonomuraea sp. SYSU D8015]